MVKNIVAVLVTIAFTRSIYAQDDVSSAAPSDFPSLAPSDAPSIVPTSWPIPNTMHHYPTVSPTLMTKHPSNQPTQDDRSDPSLSPFPLPSSSPTEIPSNAPTESCSDDTNYRSPINQLQCYQHVNTTCMDWISLGLTVDQAVELIQRCPISCGVECETLKPFDVQLTYRLNKMQTFMTSSSKNVLEKTSTQFLTSYFRRYRPDSQAIFEAAELRSQEVIEDDQQSRRLIRTLQRSTDLKITVVFNGYVVMLDSVGIFSTISDAIESQGYSNALQSSEDPSFKFVEVSLFINSGSQTDSDTDRSKSDGPSSGSMAAAFLVTALLSSVGATYYFRTRKKRRLIQKSDMMEQKLSVDVSVSSGPGDLHTEYDIEDTNGHAQVLHPVIEQASTETSVEELPNHIPVPSQRVLPRKLPPRPSSEKSLHLKSPTDNDSLEEDQDHPFSNIIPPMIVYDHIDETFEENETRSAKRTPSIVPYKTVEATKDLVAALHDRLRPFDNSTLETYPALIYDDELIPSALFLPLRSDSRSSSLPSVNTESRQDEETDLDLRIVASEGSPRKAKASPLFKVASSPKRRGFFHTPRIRSWASESSISLEDGNLSPQHREHARAFSSNDDLSTVHDGIIAKTGGISDDDKPNKKPHYSFKKFISPLSPSKIHHRHSRSSPPVISEIILPPRPPSRSGSTTSASGGETIAGVTNEGVVHCIHGPRKGKLGIIVECDNVSSPKVSHVKDYSPLLGKIMPGDQIIQVDSVDTSSMSCDEIMALLLSGRTMNRRGGGSTLQILVLRPSVLMTTDSTPH